MTGKRNTRRRPKVECGPRSDPPGIVAMSGCGDRFVLKSRLGEGGLCEVFAAIDLRRVECGDPQPMVAVKRLLPEMARQRQAREALAHEFRTLRELMHPGVVRVFDLHREGWGMCFSMELLQGGSVHAVLGGRPDGMGRGGIPLAGRIFEALSYLHAQGVTHGDIKPANIFLERDGRAVLLDFNVSCARTRPGEDGAHAYRMRKASRMPGVSLLHASPEILDGSTPSAQSDVFSACLSVFEVLTGRHPYRRMPANEAAACGMMPDRPSFLRMWQWRLLLAGLSPDARERPTARELLEGFSGRGWLARLVSRYGSQGV